MAVGESLAVSVLIEALAKATVDGAKELGALLSRNREKRATAKEELRDDLNLVIDLISWLQNSSFELLSEFQDIGNIIDVKRLSILLVRTRAYLNEDHVLHHFDKLTKKILNGSKQKYATSAAGELDQIVGLLFEFRKALVPPLQIKPAGRGSPPVLSTPLQTGVLHSELGYLLERARGIYQSKLGYPLRDDGTGMSIIATPEEIADGAQDALNRFNRHIYDKLAKLVGDAISKLS